MKKVLKIIGVILASLLCIIAILIGVMIIKGPNDVIILTEEESFQQKQAQTEILSDIDLSGFDTVSVNNEAITAKDCFSDYKITMVNIWVTNCSPCIAEMPQIAELYNERPEDSNIISICLDTSDNKKDAEFAAQVMQDSKANFMTLVPDETILAALKEKVTIFPTTIFVDSNGKVVGTPHFGGRTKDDYKNAILERIELVDSLNNEVLND